MGTWQLYLSRDAASGRGRDKIKFVKQKRYFAFAPPLRGLPVLIRGRPGLLSGTIDCCISCSTLPICIAVWFRFRSWWDFRSVLWSSTTPKMRSYITVYFMFFISLPPWLGCRAWTVSRSRPRPARRLNWPIRSRCLPGPSLISRWQLASRLRVLYSSLAQDWRRQRPRFYAKDCCMFCFQL